MDPALRALIVYGFMLVVFRILGKRTLGQITTFDFVLLLVVGESASQALMGDDFSLTTALVLIFSLIGIDYALALIKARSPRIEEWMEGAPLVIVQDGKLLTNRLKRAGLDEADVLMAARESRGIERLAQIKYAVHERGGGISIIPYDQG
jgi:uncharacterized membrane protein YcaP (DUF421 family)